MRNDNNYRNTHRNPLHAYDDRTYTSRPTFDAKYKGLNSAPHSPEYGRFTPPPNNGGYRYDDYSQGSLGRERDVGLKGRDYFYVSSTRKYRNANPFSCARDRAPHLRGEVKEN